MNRLPTPDIDDAQILVELSGNAALCSHPELELYRQEIAQAYQEYLLARGNPAAIATLPLPTQLRDALHAHFRKPPNALKFIDVERHDKAHECCPLCGSLHSGTVDHVLPRAEHPAFTVFSRNLVRACLCNSKKNAAMQGPGAGERMLHPYFDDCMSQRLVRAQFREHGPAPKVGLEILLPFGDPSYAAVAYHVSRLVKGRVKGFLADAWVQFCRHPCDDVPRLENGIHGAPDLDAALSVQLDVLDRKRKSKNNWESIFLAGLLENETFEWLLARLTAVGYQPGSPLEWG